MTLSTAKLGTLPWRVVEDWIVGADGMPVAQCNFEHDALIVRAVNAHEALVAMVEAFMGALRDEDDSFDVKYDARKLLASLE